MSLSTRDPAAWTIPLSGNPLDRADALRDQSEALSELRAAPGARLLCLHQGKPPIDLSQSPTLAWTTISPAALGAARDAPVLLGLEGGAARFAVDLTANDAPEALGLWPSPPKFIDLRSIAMELPPGQASIAAEAKSLLDWHQSHRHCARCGVESALARGGWRRDCPRCEAKHFPRVDPVVIMLIVHRSAEHGERLAIGRQHIWPEGLYSLLAGYVEPGETIEEAARRETQEEAGVEVGRVRLLASQPWPWPSTLMIGCYAEALTDTLVPDRAELEDVRWITRDELRQAFSGDHPVVVAPRRDAIARVLTEAWLDGEIEP